MNKKQRKSIKKKVKDIIKLLKYFTIISSVVLLFGFVCSIVVWLIVLVLHYGSILMFGTSPIIRLVVCIILMLMLIFYLLFLVKNAITNKNYKEY